MPSTLQHLYAAALLCKACLAPRLSSLQQNQLRSSGPQLPSCPAKASPSELFLRSPDVASGCSPAFGIRCQAAGLAHDTGKRLELPLTASWGVKLGLLLLSAQAPLGVA